MLNCWSIARTRRAQFACVVALSSFRISTFQLDSFFTYYIEVEMHTDYSHSTTPILKFDFLALSFQGSGCLSRCGNAFSRETSHCEEIETVELGLDVSENVRKRTVCLYIWNDIELPLK